MKNLQPDPSAAQPSKSRQLAAVRVALAANGVPWLRLDDAHTAAIVEFPVPDGFFASLDLITSGLSVAGAHALAETHVTDLLRVRYPDLRLKAWCILTGSRLVEPLFCLACFIGQNGLTADGASYVGGQFFASAHVGLSAAWVPGAAARRGVQR